MADSTMLDQIRSGMKVYTSDGKQLGKVRQVHQCEAESYVEVRTERSIWLRSAGTLFLPPYTVDTVAGGRVTLMADAKTAKSYSYRPRWIHEEPDDPRSSW